MEYTKKHVLKYVGKWVHCHSVYGIHQGIVHRALHDGVIIVHHTQLANGSFIEAKDVEASVYHPSDDERFEEAQFIPAPGLFIPYGGLYGIWPRPFFPI